MIPALQQKFDNLEVLRQQLIDEIRELSDKQAHYKPAEDRWSVIQVLEHVVQAECGSIAYVVKKNRAKELPTTGFVNHLRYAGLVIALHIPVRFPLPEVLAQPPNDRSLPEVLDQWNKCRKTLFGLLANIPEKRRNVLVYKHPFAGYLDIQQMLGFMHIHLKRHSGQIRRVCKAESFPA